MFGRLAIGREPTTSTGDNCWNCGRLFFSSRFAEKWKHAHQDDLLFGYINNIGSASPIN